MSVRRQRRGRGWERWSRCLTAACAAVWLWGCQVDDDGAEGEAAALPGGESSARADSARTGAAPAPAPDTVNLVDPQLSRAVAGEDGWMYSQQVEADLDGDGDGERVVLTARVETMRGRPLWDDGQPWQVYVEEASGERTYLYARFVQLGAVTMRIGLPERGAGATIVLLEHLPDRLSVHEIEYRAPGDFAALPRFVRAVDPTGEVSSPSLP